MLAGVYIELSRGGPNPGRPHSGTIWPALDAMARGCPIVEVHFRMERMGDNPDRVVSLTPAQLTLIREARDAFAEMRSHD